MAVDFSTIEKDKEGYLLNIEDWSQELAALIAGEEAINLSDAHWEIIHLVREFFLNYDLAPAMRPLVKYVATRLGKDKGNSIYLMTLFPGSPAKVVAKIAGLPRPTNCL